MEGVDNVEMSPVSRRGPSEIARYQKLDFSNLEAIWADLLKGEEPTLDLAGADVQAITLGSCFANNLAKQLVKHGIRTGQLPVSEYMNTPLYNLAMVRACLLEGDAAMQAREIVNGVDEVPEAEYLRARELLCVAKCVVFTVGVGFIWRERITRKPVLVPNTRKLADYESYFPSASEQAKILRDIAELIRSANPAATIWFTLSPVPLELSLSYHSAIVGDCVSKSILRDALHLLMCQHMEKVRYFPSFEFVRWCGSHLNRSVYGADGKVRHVDDDIIEMIIGRFLRLNGWQDNSAAA